MLNQFDILQELGEGSYGSVYQVRRKSDKQIYAMKKVNIDFLNEKERENALNEVRIMASVKHPNVIAYKECFYDQQYKVLCVIMEHADGGDLLQKIKVHRDLKKIIPEQEIWDIFIQVIQGLQAIHDHRIVHRDLKSANILLTKDGKAKLADFNVSKIVKDNMTQTQIGTPFYASPEIWNYIPYDYKADIWSMGCILYEMCCLKTPFQGSDMQSISRKVCRGRFTKIPSNYSDDMNQIISMMLQLEPQQRLDCKGILSQPFIQEKMKTATNSTLFQPFPKEKSTIKLLSTIQWSYQPKNNDIENTRKRNSRRIVTSKNDKFMNNLQVSIKLPPPDYSPIKQMNNNKLSYDETDKINNENRNSYSVQGKRRNDSSKNTDMSYNSKQYARSVEQSIDSPQHCLNNVQDSMVNKNQFQPQGSYQTINGKIVKKGNKKLQLRPLNNVMNYESYDRKHTRTDTGQQFKEKIVIKNQNSQEASISKQYHNHLMKKDNSEEPLNGIVLKSRNSESSQNEVPNNQESRKNSLVSRSKRVVERRFSTNSDDSINKGSLKNQIKFSSVQKPKEIQKVRFNESIPNSIIEEVYESNDEPKSKRKMQFKKIFDLLQGNSLQRRPSMNEDKIRSVDDKMNISFNSNRRQNNQDVRNQILAHKQVNIQELQTIQHQMQDINKIIQQSIQNKPKRSQNVIILKKGK